MISRRALLVGLLVLSTTFLACRKAPIMDIPVNSIPTSRDRTLSIDEIESAIIMGGSEAGWTMRRGNPGHVLGTIQVRTHEATVDVHYTETEWNISYVSSTNLKADGEKIHSNYNKWVNRLADSIRKQFGIALELRGPNKK